MLWPGSLLRTRKSWAIPQASAGPVALLSRPTLLLLGLQEPEPQLRGVNSRAHKRRDVLMQREGPASSICTSDVTLFSLYTQAGWAPASIYHPSATSTNAPFWWDGDIITAYICWAQHSAKCFTRAVLFNHQNNSRKVSANTTPNIQVRTLMNEDVQ